MDILGVAPVCVCALHYCLTGVNYALIRHAFFCSIYNALLASTIVVKLMVQYSVANGAVPCLVPILESRNAIGDTHIHTHTLTIMHSLACMHTNVRQKWTNHNEIEKGVIPIQNIVDAVLIVVHNLQHFFPHLLHRIALNGIAQIVCGFSLHIIACVAQIITLFVFPVVVVIISAPSLLARLFRRCALISVSLFLNLLLLVHILLQENEVINNSSSSSSSNTTIITRKSKKTENSKCAPIPKMERIPFNAYTHAYNAVTAHAIGENCERERELHERTYCRT